MNYWETNRIREQYTDGSWVDSVYCVLSILWKVCPGVRPVLDKKVGIPEMADFTLRMGRNDARITSWKGLSKVL